MRLAAIDLGTNTVRLLVADVSTAAAWRPVQEAQQVTRLGEGLTATGGLGKAAMDRTAATVTDYVARAERLGASEVLIVGTSAVRDAVNGAAFAERLAGLTGRRVRIVSGEDEARLALLGVRRGLPALDGVLVVFDIGGGSTELIRARGAVIEVTVSLRLGVVSLAERGGSDADLRRRVAAQVRAELPPGLVGEGIDHLVGTAGTVTTLAALDLGLTVYDTARVHGHVLTRAAVERQRARLAPLAVPEIARLPCLEPGRADVIRPGIAVVEAVMGALGVASLTVSETGLREGILAEALG